MSAIGISRSGGATLCGPHGGVQKWLTVKWRTLKEEEAEGGGKVGELLIDDAVLAGQKGPWWTQLLRRSSAGGRRTGSRGAASDVGAVIMVRGGRFGMPAEWSAERPEADVVAALVESERVWRVEGVKLPSAELGECVEGMRSGATAEGTRGWGGSLVGVS